MSPERTNKEVKELPDNLYIVVADDDPWQSYQNANVLASLNSTWEITQANSAQGIFILGITGNKNRPQADLMVLDGEFFITKAEDRKWIYEGSSSGNRVIDGLVRNGVDKDFAKNLLDPKGLNYAVALRTLGFEQKIIVVSNSAPAHELVKSYERDLHIPLLINGTSSKGTSRGLFFCDYRYLKGGTVGLEGTMVKGELENALSWLLPRVFSDRK